MAEISIPEEEFAEPALNYWKPVPKPPPVVLPTAMPNCIGNGSEHFGWSYPVPTYKQPDFIPPHYIYHQPPYPLTDVIHSYIQNQGENIQSLKKLKQIGLSPGGLTFEGERRRMSQCSSMSAENLLYTLSTNLNCEQENQAMMDSMIHDEVTRAAKTLFSKRNRTLLHWLNPEINKNQIKIDVNSAWDSLPATEKVFYISQVLGKFSTHSTSLMVNPQLEPSSIESSIIKSVSTNSDKITANESKKSPHNKVRQRPKKSQAKNKPDTIIQNIKTEIKSEEEDNCNNSGLVENEAKVEPKYADRAGDKQRVKRKYTKRKRKEGTLEENVAANSNNIYPFPADVKNTKVDPGTEFPIDVKDIKVEPSELAIDVKDIKMEPSELAIDVKDIKVEPSELSIDVKDFEVGPTTKVYKSSNNPLSRPKRKYVKRKLVRKKYKRREPKQKPTINTSVSSEEKSSENVPEPLKNDVEEMEMDLWIELGSDSILTNEEVDSFFDSIEDPDSLFRELGIIEN